MAAIPKKSGDLEIAPYKGLDLEIERHGNVCIAYYCVNGRTLLASCAPNPEEARRKLCDEIERQVALYKQGSMPVCHDTFSKGIEYLATKISPIK